MALTQSETFEELRRAIGLQLGAVRLYTTTSAGGDTTSVIDTHLRGGDDAHNGKWVQFYSGTLDGERQQASDYVQSTSDITTDAFTANVPTAATFELWEEWLPPQDVEGFIQQSVRGATGAIFDETVDITLHTGSTARFDIPTTFEMVSAVYVRSKMTSTQVISSGIVWDESVDSDFTITQDAEDLLYGKVSTKFVVGSGVGDGNLVSDNIGILDLSNYTHIEFPIKVSGTAAITSIAALDLRLVLSATVNGADTDKLINIPALAVGAETWVRVAMTESASSFDPSEATAIISVALEYNANSGANTIWLGEIVATQQDSYAWTKVPDHLWWVDKEARDLVFTQGGVDFMGYRLMKIVGGDNPLVPTADADVTEVPSAYIINRAAGMALLSKGGGPGTDPNSNRERARDYLGMAEQTKRTFPMLVNVRHVT